MTKDEFSALLADVTDPDKAPEAIVHIKDNVEAMFTELEEASNKAKEDAESIGKLRDMNTNLVLRITAPGGSHEPDEHEETPQELQKRILDYINKE